ncbi:hypothetical protein OD91_1987 [Lutibacter sp. Hel_I_33_5]|uniref:DUF6503 family protein n=1 Tax=Lutibacter sp. Hel_I_33_5 TaxID=1566289 RepID=UPI0011AA151A|nr:DUF6503 family protein [Lutibacter sp. Hel_I_33_5]TVZ56691.1 hypothetical protein OD91_1987 [Lutibacter sp. Hel_I_33_5]
MKKLTTLLFLFTTVLSFSQELTGEQLLDKAIKYHDPNGNWETFKGTLYVTMEIPKKPNRDSTISINLPEEFFYVKAASGENTTEYQVTKDACKIVFNGDENPSEELKTEHKLSCKRANLYKNYYTYLYGLPMKLKDPGTILDSKIEKRKFKGKDYLVLKATYTKEVGKDTWYFYFNPKTYAMEVYQFYKKVKDSGEYILLTGEEIINGVKMPKTRAWYYNKDDGYLGTDILKKSN